MKTQHKLVKILVLVIAGIASSFCKAVDEPLSSVLSELVPAGAKPCQENNRCLCVQYGTEAKVPLRFSRAQYCPSSADRSVVQFTSWDHNNKKVDEGLYVNKKMDGSWVSWHPNGNKAAESGYENGKQVGSFTTWHQNGQIAVTGEHVNDKPHGVWTYRNETGKVEKRIKWDHGKLTSKEEGS
jgi:hypothetical protein